MNVSPDIMRMLLLGCIAGMALLAALYLRRRELTTSAYLMWGLLALLLPLLGPFLVILNHPGQLRPQFCRPPRRHFTSASLIAAARRHARAHRLLSR